MLIRYLIRTGHDATAKDSEQIAQRMGMAPFPTAEAHLTRRVTERQWTPKEDLVVQLRRLITSPDATEEQRQRYQQLDQLMQKYRPILERLRAS